MHIFFKRNVKSSEEFFGDMLDQSIVLPFPLGTKSGFISSNIIIHSVIHTVLQQRVDAPLSPHERVIFFSLPLRLSRSLARSPSLPPTLSSLFTVFRLSFHPAAEPSRGRLACLRGANASEESIVPSSTSTSTSYDEDAKPRSPAIDNSDTRIHDSSCTPYL